MSGNSTINGGILNLGDVLNMSNGSILGATIDSSSTDTINSAAGTNNYIDGNLHIVGGAVVNINNGSSLYFKGGSTYTNDGVIELFENGSNTYLYADTALAKIEGTGKIVLGGTGVSTRINIRGNGGTSIFENGEFHTIEGRGDIGENTMGLINKGDYFCNDWDNHDYDVNAEWQVD